MHSFQSQPPSCLFICSLVCTYDTISLKWNSFPKYCFGGSASTSSRQPSTTTEHLCHRFSLAQIRKSTNNFDTSRKIGQAFHGDVYRGCISTNGEAKDIAVKRVKGDGMTTEWLFDDFKNEILILSQLHHPHLVSLVGFGEHKNEMMVVYEYAASGSLHDQLFGRDQKSSALSWKKRLEIIIGVARGLRYIHAGTKRTIIHRDVKPENILLDENWVPKLTGFNFSLKGPKFSSKDAKPIDASKIAGTISYLAPENFEKPSGFVTITDRSDVYSYGVVLLELICGKRLLPIYEIIDHESEDQENADEGEGEHALPTFVNVAKKVRNFAEKGNAEKIIDPKLAGEITTECWKLYMDIAESCLSEDANERPTMGEVEVELELVFELQHEAYANPQLHAFFQP